MVDICNFKLIIYFFFCGDRVLKVIKINDRYYKVLYFKMYEVEVL